MSKKKTKIPTQTQQTAGVSPSKTSIGTEPKLLGIEQKYFHWLVFGLAILLYINTIGHEYTQDDAIVIYDNAYTKNGVAGWKGIFSEDTFSGYFTDKTMLNLLSGGRYRPFTLAMFAVEYQLVGKQPWLGHTVNILLYALLCMLVYKLLVLLFGANKKENTVLALFIALVYTAHPIHTEVVANIKGRDEIVAMLASIASLYFFVKYFDENMRKYLIYSVLLFFVGLLSKENTITFLAVVPLALVFFRASSLGKALASSAYLLVPTVLFLVIRAAAVGFSMGEPPLELMNNPFLKMVNGSYIPFSPSEKLATITYVLGKYLQLLALPHPLTHDYYPKQIDLMAWSHPGVLLSLAAYAGLIFYAIRNAKNRSLIVFAIVYFLLTTSIISNILVPVGTSMNERFMFMPSLGFAIILGYFLYKYVYQKGQTTLAMGATAVLLLLYAGKTIARNRVWESDYTLFQTDVLTSTRSAKVLNAAAGSIYTKLEKEPDTPNRTELIQKGQNYINQALDIHPTYKNAHLIKGNLLYLTKNYEQAAVSYHRAVELDPTYVAAIQNEAIALQNAGRQAGEAENNLAKSEEYLLRADKVLPNNAETLRLLGVLNGVKGNHAQALGYFEKVVQLEPNNSSALLNLGKAYDNMGNTAMAQKYLNMAQKIDPSIK
jgi:protein O-mannosyl-transferase